MKVLVTGGSGRAGKYVIKELVKRNHQVVNGDIIESHQNLENSKVKFKKINFTDYGETIFATEECEAICFLLLMYCKPQKRKE